MVMIRLMELDPVVFGHRLRHFRTTRGLTLSQVGEMIGRPAPFLSLLENGKREAKLSVITALARALQIDPAELMEAAAPNRRADLEIRLEQAQLDPVYRRLGLPHFKPGAKTPDLVLEHLLTLFDQLANQGRGVEETDSVLRQASAQAGEWLRIRDGYLDRIEKRATRLLGSIGYAGGPLTSRNILDIAEHFGYTLRTIDDIPPGVRSIIDDRTQSIYVAQRNELRTRQARKAILQTVATQALEHQPAVGLLDQLIQTVETAYFAAAVLIPETVVVPALQTAHKERDLAVGDIKEMFYVSYEMAAQRLANLARPHLGLDSHFLRVAPDGIIWKALVLDGLPLATDDAGGVLGRRICHRFGAVAALRAEDRFDIHYQFTDTPVGSFWCATQVAVDHDGHTFTFGVRYEDARVFRGRRTNHQVSSACPDEECCRRPLPGQIRIQHRVHRSLIERLSDRSDADAIAEVVEQERSRETPSQPD